MMAQTLIYYLDDDILGSKILTRLLSKYGFKVIKFHSYHDLKKAIEDELPTLILLDIIMPEISGIEILIQLRADYTKMDLPILMVSSNDGSSDIVEAMKNGANDYLTKPVDIDIAVERIKTQVSLIDLKNKSNKAKQLEAINALIGTYNHEINNPLTIALGKMRKPKEDLSQSDLDKVTRSLNRIKDIVTKIGQLQESGLDNLNYNDGDSILKFSSNKYIK